MQETIKDMDDAENFRQPWESDEHWELRKEFLEVHAGNFPEDRLLCLAQVYTNVELLGCKYPDKVMQQVCELAKDMKMARKLREERKQRAAINFVKAEEAKMQKNSRTGEKRHFNDNSPYQNKFSRPWSGPDRGSNSYSQNSYGQRGYQQSYNTSIPSYSTKGGGSGDSRQGVW